VAELAAPLISVKPQRVGRRELPRVAPRNIHDGQQPLDPSASFRAPARKQLNEVRKQMLMLSYQLPGVDGINLSRQGHGMAYRRGTFRTSGIKCVKPH
jgi:hypothetical protein